jgi:hypothetical protein
LISIHNVFFGFNYVSLPVALLHNCGHVFFRQFFLKLVSV